MTPLLETIKALISIGQIASLFAIIFAINHAPQSMGIVLLIAGILPIIKLFFPNPITHLEIGAAIAGLVMFVIGMYILIK